MNCVLVAVFDKVTVPLRSDYYINCEDQARMFRSDVGWNLLMDEAEKRSNVKDVGFCKELVIYEMSDRGNVTPGIFPGDPRYVKTEERREDTKFVKEVLAAVGNCWKGDVKLTSGNVRKWLEEEWKKKMSTEGEIKELANELVVAKDIIVKMAEEIYR